MKNLILQDKTRYGKEKMPFFQFWFRKSSERSVMGIFSKVIFKCLQAFRCNEIPSTTKIGGGLYLGHAYAITINKKVIIGRNCNIHKGVTIGQENRGERKGTPIIGDKVWIGVNATIVGNISIGNDVLIAPNTYVNCNIPSHSIVFGNPCIIKHSENATYGYINRIVE